MVGAIAAADLTPVLIDPRIYHVAQETYRARLAELGPDRHVSALNAAIDAVGAELLAAGWSPLLAGGEAA